MEVDRMANQDVKRNENNCDGCPSIGIIGGACRDKECSFWESNWSHHQSPPSARRDMKPRRGVNVNAAVFFMQSTAG